MFTPVQSVNNFRMNGLQIFGMKWTKLTDVRNESHSSLKCRFVKKVRPLSRTHKTYTIYLQLHKTVNKIVFIV